MDRHVDTDKDGRLDINRDSLIIGKISRRAQSVLRDITYWLSGLVACWIEENSRVSLNLQTRRPHVR